MEEAWPFLIGRSLLAGHRVVVAPGCLTSDASLYPLERLARGNSATGEAYIADIGPLGGLTDATAIFRVFPARGSDFFGSGDEVLTDRGGRGIRITEGVVIPLSSDDVRRLSLTSEDLLLAHEAVVPHYREFWEAEDQYPLQRSARIRVGDGTGVALGLRVPDMGMSASGTPTLGDDRADGLAVHTEQAKREQVPSPQEPLPVTKTAEAVKRSPITIAVLAGISAFVIILAVSTAFAYISLSGQPGHHALPGATGSASPTASPTIPEDFAGTWKSADVQQLSTAESPPSTFELVIQLTAGATSGLLELENNGVESCDGSLALQRVESTGSQTELVFDLGDSPDDKYGCVPGTVKVTDDGSGSLGYTWQAASGGAVSSTTLTPAS